jgi:hypothetical protein
MLQKLSSLQNVNIKVGVVTCAGIPIKELDLTPLNATNESTIEMAMKANRKQGSNMQGGLVIADKMLSDSNDGVSDSNKYIINITDGCVYYWDNDDASMVYSINSDYQNRSITPSQQAKVPEHSFADLYPDYSKLKYTQDGWNKYDLACIDKNGDLIRTIDGDSTYCPDAELGVTTPTCVEKGIYMAAQKYAEMAKRYRCINLYWTYAGTGDGFYNLAKDFMTWTGTVGNSYNLTDVKNDQLTDVFSAIQNSMLYQLASGTVTDVIGNSFNLAQTTDTCPFTLTLNGKALTATADKDNANKWNFSNGTFADAYSVEYQPNAAAGEQLVWTINVPVENANPVQLSYTLKLTRSTRAGTYTVPTNDSAELSYVSTNGTEGSEFFDVPSVTYTVRSNPIVIPSDNPQPSAEPSPTPSTTPSPEPTDIPEPSTPLADLPEDLNSTDHITYIAGYPDGTVRPNGQITRAEVATAFYRLLTAARRDAVFTATPAYSDMNASQWFNKAVSSMANGKYVTGYPNGTFGGNKSITRAEFVAIAARFMNAKAGTVTFTDVPSSNWAYQYISTAVAYGWINGYPDGSFKPNQPITRAEAMKIINTMLARGVDAAGLMAGAKLWPDNANTAMWYYYEVEEATNNHLYTGTRPSETWTSLTTSYIYDMAKYERP